MPCCAGSLQYVTGDGREGMLSEAPFDVIYCGAAAEDIPGDILVQLKEGGYMVVPLGHTNPSVGFLGALGGAQVTNMWRAVADAIVWWTVGAAADSTCAG